MSVKPLLAEVQRIANEAKADPERVFTNLAHLIDPELLREAYWRTRKDGAAGVDRVTGREYGERLEENLHDLHQRLKERRYRAQPVKRVYIEKEGGKKRPLGIPAFEDKIVQRAVVMLLEAIYEQDFLDCSYGFRPKRSAHQALHALREQCMQGWVNWIVDADIQGFFDQLDRQHLRELLHRRVKDGGIDRLIGKFFGAGVLDGGELLHPERGTPQGGVLSPLLANVYLHYVLDEWFTREVKPRLKGRAFLVRYADDFVIGCEREDDAHRLLEALGRRLDRYGLALHPDKTRLLRFWRQGRHAPTDPENGTFDFLGFTHYWGRSVNGYWVVKRGIQSKRARRALKGLWETCREHRHAPLPKQQLCLSRKLKGLYQYYGIRGTAAGLRQLYGEAVRAWRYWLGRRSQKSRLTWPRFRRLLERWPLPSPKIAHWSI